MVERSDLSSDDSFIDIAHELSIYRLAISSRWVEEGEVTHQAFYRAEKDITGLSAHREDRYLLDEVSSRALAANIKKVHGLSAGECSEIIRLSSKATGLPLKVKCLQSEEDSGDSHAEIHGLDCTPKADGVFDPSDDQFADAWRLWKKFATVPLGNWK